MKSRCNFFATNAPDPPHWTLNSCFGVFHCVWVHLGSFRNCMKLGAIRGELMQLMQKFVTRSHVGIFCNECTQSTPLDPKLMFRCVHSISVHLGSFCNCMNLVAKQTELVQLMQKFMPRNSIVIFHNQRTWSTPLDPKLMFWCVSLCLGAFGIVS